MGRIADISSGTPSFVSVPEGQSLRKPVARVRVLDSDAIEFLLPLPPPAAFNPGI